MLLIAFMLVRLAVAFLRRDVLGIARLMDADARRRRAIASAGTAHAFDAYILAGDLLKLADDLVSARVIAGHVTADAHGDFRRLFRSKVREETRDGVQAIQRDAGIFGELLHLVPLEIAVL